MGTKNLSKLNVKTSRHTQMLDITAEVQRCVTESGVKEGIYFCEYDGPRSRRVCVKILEG